MLDTTTTQPARTPVESGADGRAAQAIAAATTRSAAGKAPNVLFPDADAVVVTQEPEFFRDLNLDQIVESITKGREAVNLKPFFYTPLTRLDQIAFRHEIMSDVQNETLFAGLKSFSEKMLAMRDRLSTEKVLHYQYQKERTLLRAAEHYVEAVENLCRDLTMAGVRSRGLTAFRDFLGQYVASAAFKTLADDTRSVRDGLAAVRYCVLIQDSNITVRNYDAEADYGTEVEETFGIFKQAAAKDYHVEFPESSAMNHVESMILDFVAKLNPAAFAALDGFYTKHPTFVDAAILEFDRGIQFYVSYLDYVKSLAQAGLRFCFPIVSETSKETLSRGGFDLALASKLIASQQPPVCNDFQLTGAERLIVITGPNQGGKTTFARAFGQLHYLASLGCPVPGTEVRVSLVDRVFTHFDTEENIANLSGKLKDDLARMHRILDQATPRSLVVMNEIFASTSLEDAIYLGRNMLERFTALDVLGVCVTFLDELSTLNEKVVSMSASIVPENPTQRTFRITRMPASGLAYALALAEKYHLTYGSLKGRITK
jgi:DNA mismatch repair ATPase MutS